MKLGPAAATWSTTRWLLSTQALLVLMLLPLLLLLAALEVPAAEG